MGSKLKAFFYLLLLPYYLLFCKELKNPFVINNIEVVYNFPIEQLSKEFFDVMNRYAQNSDREFLYRNFPATSLYIEIPHLTKFTINLEWINLNYTTRFNKNETYSFNNIWRSYSENFNFNFFPLSLSFFITPVESDFYSQFHLQFGISIDKVQWDEYVDSDLSDDPKLGLKTFRETRFSPFFTFAIRNILPFDIFDSNQFVNYFFAEARFMLSYRTFALFSKLNEAFDLGSQTTILPFSIVFSIGLNFNTRSFFLK